MPLSSSVSKHLGPQMNVHLIHGWGMHSGFWGPLAERLQGDGYRPHLISLPGHGGAPPLPRNDLMALTHALAERIDKPSRLIGWSLGGTVALMIAATYPERVTDLILTGTSPCFVQRPDWPHGMVDSTFADFRARVQTDPGRALNWFLGLQIQGSADERQTLRELRRLTGEASTTDTKTLLEDLDILKDNDLRTTLAQIKAPVIVIHGERDALVPVVAAEHLVAELPDARLTCIEGAGHAPFLSHPDVFYSALRGGLNA